MLVATTRAADALLAGDVEPDVLVASGRDEKERAGLEALPAPRRATVLPTARAAARWHGADGASGHAGPPPSRPGPPVDAYGCGDSFAAGLTYGLAAGMELPARARARRPLRRALPHRPRPLRRSARARADA